MAEQEIIKGCIQNNAQCQHTVFKQYAGRMMSVCLRYAATKPEAEDMLHDAFIKIFSSIKQFRSEGSFEGWIRKITVNTCLALLNKKRIFYSDAGMAEAITDEAGLNIISGLTEKELIKMISRLPDGYRIVFNLYVIEGYDHDEIAAMLNIKTVTSRSQLVKARKLLQKQILSQQKITSRHDG